MTGKPFRKQKTTPNQGTPFSVVTSTYGMKERPVEYGFMAMNNLLPILESGEHSDIKLIIGAGPDQREYASHKAILSGVSGYFRKALSPNSNFKESNSEVIRLPDVDTEVFDYMIRFFYANRWDGPEDFGEMAAIYAMADYFDMPSVKASIMGELCYDMKRGDNTKSDNFVAVKTILKLYREEDAEIFLPIMEKFRNNRSFGHIVGEEGEESISDILLDNPKLALYVIQNLL